MIFPRHCAAVDVPDMAKMPFTVTEPMVLQAIRRIEGGRREWQGANDLPVTT
ncbi:hypothetical protein QUF31_14310 [Dickeya chrysanthemi]|uniref:hypothetical protein n=1 Tax=Dickeya chrysanthemi TaxID=556 RepID=UPI0025A2A539|nr:hypothetical protein [Dickeya chrysanthemi]WJM84318.1 hypothetical protein QUF31_14310 [Dickeya chrysanthemi]